MACEAAPINAALSAAVQDDANTCSDTARKFQEPLSEKASYCHRSDQAIKQAMHTDGVSSITRWMACHVQLNHLMEQEQQCVRVLRYSLSLSPSRSTGARHGCRRADRLLLDEAVDEVGDGGHLAPRQQHAHGPPLGVSSRAVLLDLQQGVRVRQQLGGEEQQDQVGLPGQLVGQHGVALVVLAAGWVVLHQRHWVQQPHVPTSLPVPKANPEHSAGRSPTGR